MHIAQLGSQLQHQAQMTVTRQLVRHPGRITSGEEQLGSRQSDFLTIPGPSLLEPQPWSDKRHVLPEGKAEAHWLALECIAAHLRAGRDAVCRGSSLLDVE